MESRYVAIVGLHVAVALVFVAVATWNVVNGDVVGAVLQGVLGVLVAALGLGIARTV